ncbi:MAG: hypothetical protein V1774_10135 [Candidatus Eisenbacteria bacterium]
MAERRERNRVNFVARAIAWGAAALSLLAPGTARGQAEYSGEVRKSELFQVPIVVEDFDADLPGGAEAVLFSGGERAEDVLIRDLLYTDAFQIIRERKGAAREAGPRLDVRGALVDRPVQARVQGRLEKGRRGPHLTLRLIEEASRDEIIACGYDLLQEGEDGPDRWQIHLWSDEVTRYLTGAPGCAATRIAFTREVGAAKEIHLIDWDGEEQEEVTGLGSILVSPGWHPGGGKLAFTSYHRGQPILVSLDLGSRRMITLSTASTPTAAAYSPNGRQIAFSATPTGNAEIYVARADGSQPRRLTLDPGIDTAPDWSPSGERLVFTSDRGGTPQLYIVDADGSNLIQLTFGGRWNDSPDWSPDGRRVVHVCGSDGRFDLAVIGVDGMGWRRLTEGGGCEDPHWAPDSRHVVFARSDRGSRSLWILDVDSGTLRQLTPSKTQTYNPAWSPLADRRIRAEGTNK